MISDFNKLLEIAAGGLDAVAGPFLAPWKARKEGQARIIAAQADAKVLEIWAEAVVKAHEITEACPCGDRRTVWRVWRSDALGNARKSARIAFRTRAFSFPSRVTIIPSSSQSSRSAVLENASSNGYYTL